MKRLNSKNKFTELEASNKNKFTELEASNKNKFTEPRHIVRLTWFITHPDDYRALQSAIGEAYSEIIGRHYPAMSVVVVDGLLETNAKVEIEATAVIPD